jgi:hypothetical protein
MLEIFTAISDFANACKKADLHYVIGGSVCSGIHSIIRNTNDVDVVISRSLHKNDIVVTYLCNKFIVDEIGLEKSHLANRSFNIFHEESAIKFDLFPPIGEFQRAQLDRAVLVQPASAQAPFRIASLEDIIVAKLNWLHQSGSQRQREDLLTLIAVNKEQIDRHYIELWAGRFGILKLFKEIF